MAFFPLNKDEHYYLAVFNLKNGGYDIIDNKRRSINATKTCYGGLPKRLAVQDREILRLRVKYNHAILSSEFNENREQILAEGHGIFIQKEEGKRQKKLLAEQ
ncbi:hypothetical protein ACET3Z_013351 [Daucus carota]